MVNVLNWVEVGTVIVIDDVLPNHPSQASPIRVTRNWAGDVYKIMHLLSDLAPKLPRVLLDVSPTGLLVFVKSRALNGLNLARIIESASHDYSSNMVDEKLVNRSFDEITLQRSGRFEGIETEIRRLINDWRH